MGDKEINLKDLLKMLDNKKTKVVVCNTISEYEAEKTQKTKKDNSSYKAYVKKLEESKYHFTEIDDSNLEEINYNDIMFYLKAEAGAMGESGGIEILTKDGKFYHTNIVEEFDLYERLMNEKLEPLNRFEAFIGRPADVPDEFEYYDLGFGNSLLVNTKINENRKNGTWKQC